MQKNGLPKVYALSVAIVLGAMAIGLAVWGYEGSFLLVNAWGTPVLDTLMLYLTHLGDGAILGGLVGVALARKHPERVLGLLVMLGLAALIIALCKQLFFNDWDRPLRMLGTEAVYHIAGHEPHHKSFPSGHALTAFLGTAVWASTVRGGIGQGLLAGLAILLAYTRVYLGVHFIGDILVGGLLGLGLAAFGICVIEKKIIARFTDRLSIKHRKWLTYTLVGIAAMASTIGLGVRLLGGFYD